MTTKLNNFNKTQLKKDLPEIRPGDTVRIYQKIKDVGKKGKSSKGEKKTRIQKFEGLVLAIKHGRGITSTLTVRKIVSGVGVERIFPLHLPSIEKIEVLKRGKARRAKLYYLRKIKGKKAKLKKKDSFKEVIPIEETAEEIKEEKIEEEKEEKEKEAQVVE